MKALIPAHLEDTNREVLDNLLAVYKDDLPMTSSFEQEFNWWQRNGLYRQKNQITSKTHLLPAWYAHCCS